MVRTTALAALVLSVLYTLPAHAVSCFHCECNYAVNGDFANSSTWSFTNCGGGTYCGTVQQTDPCGAFTWMAQLSYAGTTIKMQQVTFPAGTGPFSIAFDVISYTIPGTWYDELRVYVKDVSTGTLDFIGSVHGDQLSSGCQRFSLPTSKSYAGKTVELSFVVGSLSSITWYLDNVAFWEGYTC